MSHVQEWTRIEAERRIREVLDNAKSGEPQKIIDSDGLFEIRFRTTGTNETAGSFLARGGPDDE